MNILFVILALLILGSIVLAIIISYKLQKSPTIELIQEKLNDEKCCDDIELAINYLKIVNK